MRSDRAHEWGIPGLPWPWSTQVTPDVRCSRGKNRAAARLLGERLRGTHLSCAGYHTGTGTVGISYEQLSGDVAYAPRPARPG